MKAEERGGEYRRRRARRLLRLTIVRSRGSFVTIDIIITIVLTIIVITTVTIIYYR